MMAMLSHQVPDFIISKTRLSIVSSVVKVFGIILIKHICNDVFNMSKDYLPESVYNQGKNGQLRFGN